jgi:predicted RNA-binding Zn-ribbon protein involved in translation (DUF1610 family)
MTEAFVSNENLPSGQSRCPRCGKTHAIASCRLPPRKLSVQDDAGRRAIAAFYRDVGLETSVVHLSCPHCGTTYEVTQGVDASQSSAQTGRTSAAELRC